MINIKENQAEEKGKQVMLLISVLNDLREVIWEKQDYVKPRERFYYTIFMKLSFLLDSIHIQIFNLDNKPHYIIVSSLALRTCMLDVLNLYFIMDSHEDEDVAYQRINTIMSDHLKYVYKELTLDQKKEISKDWPELFDNEGSLINFGRVNTGKLIKGIKNFESLKKEAKEALHLYKIFSKYEHNGAFTYGILHNPYSPQGNELVKYLTYEALGICAMACKYISVHWLLNDHPLTDRLDNAIKDILDIKMNA
jgi:hypothetical protein